MSKRRTRDAPAGPDAPAADADPCGHGRAREGRDAERADGAGTWGHVGRPQSRRRNFEGMTHEFFGMGAAVPAAIEAQQYAGERLKGSLGRWCRVTETTQVHRGTGR